MQSTWQNWTPLHIVCDKGHATVCSSLLNQKVNVTVSLENNDENSSGGTVIDLAVA